MKKRYINIGIVIICIIVVVALYLYDVFWRGVRYTENLFRVLCVLLSIALSFMRSRRRLLKQSFQTYENTYKSIIGNAFYDDENLKRRLLLGIYDYNNERYKRAIKRLSRLCEVAAKNSDVAACMIFMALAYEDSGCIHDAMGMYKKVLKIAPQNATANNNLALLYSFSGDAEKALEHYKTAIAGNPDFERGYLNRAYLYLEIYRPGEAISDAKKVLDINKDSREAAVLLSVAYDLRKDAENAKRYYDKALELGCDNKMIDLKIKSYREIYEQTEYSNKTEVQQWT